MFGAVFKAVGESPLATLARLDVPELGRLDPNVLVCDFDATETDSLEVLRQIRFVLPECLIAVYPASRSAHGASRVALPGPTVCSPRTRMNGSYPRDYAVRSVAAVIRIPASRRDR